MMANGLGRVFDAQSDRVDMRCQLGGLMRAALSASHADSRQLTVATLLAAIGFWIGMVTCLALARRQP